MSLVRDELQSSKKAMADVFANPALRRVFYAFGGSLIGDGVFALSAVVLSGCGSSRKRTCTSIASRTRPNAAAYKKGRT